MAVCNNLSRLIEVSNGVSSTFSNNKELDKRLFGRFYTHETIAYPLIDDILSLVSNTKQEAISIVDPFCGDGRLIIWLLRNMDAQGLLNGRDISISLWDCDTIAIQKAQKAIKELNQDIRMAHVDLQITNSFEYASKYKEEFDICITNPPWEILKPDRRELATLSKEMQNEYISLLREKTQRLEELYPHSRPTKKFSGWGASLSRIGLEASIKITKPGGVFAVVLPASLFGDQVSSPLRAWLFESNNLHKIRYFPSSLKLFEDVDQDVATLCGTKSCAKTAVHDIVLHSDVNTKETDTLALSDDYLQKADYKISFSTNSDTIKVLSKLQSYPKVSDYEGKEDGCLWLGRELDETGLLPILLNEGKHRFIKGKMLTRYFVSDDMNLFIPEGMTIPESASQLRLAWRDVARQTSKRRLQAALIPPGMVTGNSVNIGRFRGNNPKKIKAFLAILNSTVMEAQVRANIATNHLSVGAIRQLRMPELDSSLENELANLVDLYIKSSSLDDLAKIEIKIAMAYKLNREEFLVCVKQVEKIDDVEKEKLIKASYLLVQMNSGEKLC